MDKRMRSPTSNRNSKVAVVTTALSTELITEHGLYVTRMEITINGNTYVDGSDDDPGDFYQRMIESSVTPTISPPKPTAYLERFRAAAEKFDRIFCLSMSAQHSAAYDSAIVASKSFETESAGTAVRVFDSETVGSSLALIALAAARTAAGDGTLEDVENTARKIAGKTRMLVVLDTLHYIEKSGRVPKIAVWATKALNIKPVIEYSAGEFRVIARPRSTRKALERLRSEMLADLSGKPAHVVVTHADAPELAEELRSWVSENFDCSELFITELHPFIGAHTGPRSVGASWWAEYV